MTDIDFDELDKAVMSLMKDVKPDAKPATSDDEVPEKVLSINSADEKTKAPASEPGLTTPVKAEPAVKLDTASMPIVRRSGRIMDVAKGTSPTPITKRVSRQAAIITPPSATISDVIVPNTGAKKPLVLATEQVEEKTTASSDPHTMPDPIDFTAMKAAKVVEEEVPEQEPVEPSPPEPAAVETLEVEVKAVEDPKPTTTSSDYTPFIPDAKVEKRPLGTPAPLTESVPAVQPPSAPQDASSTPPEVPAVQADLPDELDTNLVAIESGAASADHETEESSEGQATSAERPTGSGDRFAGQAQIPQQYQEVTSSGEQEHVPIYDTAALHQPLTHPAKKPAGWLWIIWILAIMLLGAGVAAALYYFHVL